MSVILAIKGMENSNVKVRSKLRITWCAVSAHCVLEPEPHCVCDTGYRGDEKVQCQGTFYTQNHLVCCQCTLCA